MNAKSRRNAEKFGLVADGAVSVGARLAATSRGRLVAPAPTNTDDLAVDGLAHAQKLKLAQCRDMGRRGWDNPLECSIERLAMLLGIAVSKGDPVDIANYAAMLRARGAGHSTIAEQAMRSLLRASREDLGQRIEELEGENAVLRAVAAAQYGGGAA